jgi:hypothetical protein
MQFTRLAYHDANKVADLLAPVNCPVCLQPAETPPTHPKARHEADFRPRLGKLQVNVPSFVPRSIKATGGDDAVPRTTNLSFPEGRS